MCGRFTQTHTWREIRDLYELTGDARNLQARYNIAPTTTVDIVRLGESGATELVPMRWGLVADALGSCSALVEEAAEGIASDIQRARRERSLIWTVWPRIIWTVGGD
jgi:putative SOS response-associated peptidase YedK